MNTINNKKIDRISLFLLMILIVVLSSIFSLSLALGIIQIPFILSTFYFLRNKSTSQIKYYAVIFIVSICFVFIVYFANQFKFGLPYYNGGSDDFIFEKQGLLISHSNIYSPSKILDSGIIDRWTTYPIFISYISVIFKISNFLDGYSTFIPRILNVYFLLWSCILFEHILRKYSTLSEKNRHLAILIFALTPNIQYINAHIFRDTLNLLQLLFTIFATDKIFDRHNRVSKLFYLILLILNLYFMYYTRPNSLVFAGAITMFLILSKSRINMKYSVFAFLPAIFASGFLEFIGYSRFINVYNEYNLMSAGDGLSSIVFSQPLLPFGIILRSVYALISPFPNIFQLFKDINSILYDITFLFIYLGVLITAIFSPFIFKRILKIDFLLLSFMVIFLGTISTTFTFRHVLLYYPFMVALIVEGYSMVKDNNKLTVVFLSTFGLFSLGAMYVFLKVL